MIQAGIFFVLLAFFIAAAGFAVTSVGLSKSFIREKFNRLVYLGVCLVTVSAAILALILGVSGIQVIRGLNALSESFPAASAPVVDGTTHSDAEIEDLETVEGDNDLEPPTWEVVVNDTTYEVDPGNMGPYSPGDTFSLAGTEAQTLVTFGTDGPQEMTDFNTTIGNDPGSYSYIRVDVDNRGGSDSVSLSDIQVLDEEGESYDYSDAYMALNDRGPWMDEEYNYMDVNGNVISEEEYDRQNTQLTTLYDEYGDTSVEVGEVATFWLIGPTLPDSFTTIHGNGSIYDVEFIPATKV